MTTPFLLSSNQDKTPQVLQSRAISLSLSKLGLPQRCEALSTAVTRSYLMEVGHNFCKMLIHVTLPRYSDLTANKIKSLMVAFSVLLKEKGIKTEGI